MRPVCTERAVVRELALAPLAAPPVILLHRSQLLPDSHLASSLLGLWPVQKMLGPRAALLQDAFWQRRPWAVQKLVGLIADLLQDTVWQRRPPPWPMQKVTGRPCPGPFAALLQPACLQTALVLDARPLETCFGFAYSERAASCALRYFRAGFTPRLL